MPKKYEYAVPHQQDVPNERQRKAFRDINEQFKQIALDVGNLTTQVASQGGTTTATQAPVLVQQLPSAQPIQQPSGGTTPGVMAVITFLVDASGAPVVQALPAASTVGQIVIIQKTDATANGVTGHPDGTDTINGVNADTAPITLQTDTIDLIVVAVGAWIIF